MGSRIGSGVGGRRRGEVGTEARRALLRWGAGAGHGPGMADGAPSAAQAPGIVCAGPCAAWSSCRAFPRHGHWDCLASGPRGQRSTVQAASLAGLLEPLMPLSPAQGRTAGPHPRPGPRASAPPWGEPSAESTHSGPLPSGLSSSRCASGAALGVRHALAAGVAGRRAPPVHSHELLGGPAGLEKLPVTPLWPLVGKGCPPFPPAAPSMCQSLGRVRKWVLPHVRSNSWSGWGKMPVGGGLAGWASGPEEEVQRRPGEAGWSRGGQVVPQAPQWQAPAAKVPVSSSFMKLS